MPFVVEMVRGSERQQRRHNNTPTQTAKERRGRTKAPRKTRDAKQTHNTHQHQQHTRSLLFFIKKQRKRKQTQDRQSVLCVWKKNKNFLSFCHRDVTFVPHTLFHFPHATPLNSTHNSRRWELSNTLSRDPNPTRSKRNTAPPASSLPLLLQLLHIKRRHIHNSISGAGEENKVFALGQQ